MPTTKELARDWRLDTATRSAAADGDFDGDGQIDFARLLMRDDNRAQGLFVWLSTGRRWTLVDSIQAIENKESFEAIFMGLDVVPPGEERAYCKDETPCDQSARSIRKFERAALDYYRPGSAVAIGYFEPTTAQFVWLWYTD